MHFSSLNIRRGDDCQLLRNQILLTREEETEYSVAQRMRTISEFDTGTNNNSVACLGMLFRWK
jgi:hypothetical protein